MADYRVNMRRQYIPAVIGLTMFSSMVDKYKESEKMHKLVDIEYKQTSDAKLERLRIKEETKQYHATPLKHFKIYNTEYNTMVSKLNALNNIISRGKINDIYGKDNDIDTRNLHFLINDDNDNKYKMLMDELKFAVLYKHFQQTDNVMQIFDPASLVAIGDWCGAGTSIRENINKDTKFKIDNICKTHDLNYAQSRNRLDIHKADITMLIDILDTFVLKGTKQTINDIYKTGNLPVEQVKDYILNLLYEFGDNPLKTITTLASPSYDTLSNVASNMRLYNLLLTNRGEGLLELGRSAGEILLLRERLLALVAFGAISMKLLYDISIGKATDTVYGYNNKEHKFNPQDISEIIKDIEQLENQRLESMGIDNIDMNDILAMPLEDINNLDIIEEETIDETNEPEYIEEEEPDEYNEYIEGLTGTLEIGINEL